MIIGPAIGAHLSGTSGLLSVELPPSFQDEAIELVRAVDPEGAGRAVLVSEEDPEDGIKVVDPGAALAWRTNEDRVFVWIRGTFDPDSSFRSAVKPFISARFPASGSSDCSHEEFTRLTITRLLRDQGVNDEEILSSFVVTARAVALALASVYEGTQTKPSEHWTDHFLDHWRLVLDSLHQSMASAGIQLETRHAWEVIRVSGLPLPSKLVAGTDDPFSEAPPSSLGEDDWKKIARDWRDFCQVHFASEAAANAVLFALQRMAKRDGLPATPWSDLYWPGVVRISSSEPVLAGPQRFFVARSCLSLVTGYAPPLGVKTGDEWWGVTDQDLYAALEAYEKGRRLSIDPTLDGLKNAFFEVDQAFTLETRFAALSTRTSSRSRTIQLDFSGLTLFYEENWESVDTSTDCLSGSVEGATYIDPGSCEVRIGQANARVTSVTVDSRKVRIEFDLTLTVKNALEQDGTVSGSWNALRKLQVNLSARDHVRGAWQEPRKISVAARIVTPSPYAPTFVVARKNKLSGVGSGDHYTANAEIGSPWEAEVTPTLLLRDRDRYEVTIYDGTLLPTGDNFAEERGLTLQGSTLRADAPGYTSVGERYLDEDYVLGAVLEGDSSEVAVIKVQERRAGIASGLVRATRRNTLPPENPPLHAQESLLGKCELALGEGLVANLGNLQSLFQFIVSADDPVPPVVHHEGKRTATRLFEWPIEGQPIGEGPTEGLASTPEWARFCEALWDVVLELRIDTSEIGRWLSTPDPSILPGTTLQNYLESHVDLVQEARSSTMADVFWASYPLSVVVIQGEPPGHRGNLLAVLLSPLHPVRLAWAFSVATFGWQSRDTTSRSLLLLAEGWNLPQTGNGVGATAIPLVAHPVDPGPAEYFSAWSGLCALDQYGSTMVPPVAGGYDLPWAGGTGITASVVRGAVTDFLRVHPHLESLQLELQALTKAPRSKAIDTAVLELAARRDLEELKVLQGNITVWDSSRRQGNPPTRDQFLAHREVGRPPLTFGWKRFEPGRSPENVDVALVENSEPSQALHAGKPLGQLGLLPMRRYSPAGFHDKKLEVNYSVSPGNDLLGLGALLQAIEFKAHGQVPSKLEITMPSTSLGAGSKSRWTVLGDLSLDPAVLSTFIAEAGAALEDRYLWEWRPSWLATGASKEGSSKETSIDCRPYFIVAKLPASFVKSLVLRQQLEETQVLELVQELGKRGIGMASLYAQGGARESGAAGFFYAYRVLFPPVDSPLPAKWLQDVDPETTVFGMVPLDPVWSIFQAIAGSIPQQKADFLLFRVTSGPDGPVELCVVPLEVKHRGDPEKPDCPSTDDDKELVNARKQLDDTRKAVQKLAENLSKADPDYPLDRALKLQGLAAIVDLGLSFSPVPASPELRSRITGNILAGKVSVGLSDSLLCWFSPGAKEKNGCVLDSLPFTVDPLNRRSNARELFIDPRLVTGMFWSGAVVTDHDRRARDKFDELMKETFASCASASEPRNVKDEIEKFLGLSLPSVPLEKEGDVTIPSPGKTEAEPTEAEPTGVGPGEELPGEEGKAAGVPGTGEGEEAELDEQVEPSLFVGLGNREVPERWCIIGKRPENDAVVALDLEQPKCMGIFGYMGSGKTYLLNCIIEAAAGPIPGINRVDMPMAVVIFNYRRNASDRFELGSLAIPNDGADEVRRLAEEYGAKPKGVESLHALALPNELKVERLEEYGDLDSSELYFDPETLSLEDWDLLMGVPAKNAVFAKQIQHQLRSLEEEGRISIEALEERVKAQLSGGSKAAALLRLEFVKPYLSTEKATDFSQLVAPGKVLVVDLRKQLFDKEDALRMFLVCTNQISKLQGRFNKLIVFDEAHEYLSPQFEEKLAIRIKQMRHEGASYIFATQDIGSIPRGIAGFLATNFVFDIGTEQNEKDLAKLSTQYGDVDLFNLEPGTCQVLSTKSTNRTFAKPRKVRIRPRASRHGGGSRVYT